MRNVRAEMLLHFALGASWDDLARWGGYPSAGRTRTAVWRYVAGLPDRRRIKRKKDRARGIRLLAQWMAIRERERT